MAVLQKTERELQMDRIESKLDELLKRVAEIEQGLKSRPISTKTHENVDSLYERLRLKRADLAKKNRAPAFTICQTELLEEISEKRPKTIAEMSLLPFRGQQFKNYGPEFLNVVLEFEREFAQ